ncbi:MAG: ferrochelatase [Melioribacter sp.]|nr:ferrochelatase [Melioribacter sp.]
MNKYTVVLLNLGGPDSLEAVEPFLYNLFCDPDIFKLPFAQKLFAKLISHFRAPKVIEEYKLIGGKSPIGEWTEIQRKKLENKLRERQLNVDVHVAMRYWKPFTKDVVQKIERENYSKIILLPLYPHYSFTTTGSSFNEWNRNYKGDKNKLVYIKNYHLNEKYIDSLNQRIDETISKFPQEEQKNIHLIFSAHGTPISEVKKGDPYSHQIKETMEAIMKARNYSHPYHLAFQSKVGPMKWLEPATDKVIEDLGKDGIKNLLVVPISFVSDHIETLYELDIEYRHVAHQVGVENYFVIKGLNDSDLFVEALVEEVLKVLN